MPLLEPLDSAARLFQEVLLAAVLGDAVGLPVAMTGAPGAPGIVVDGLYAYGSIAEMMLLLAESVAENCGFNPRGYAEALASRADVENPLRLYHPATAAAINGIRRGKPWWEARRQPLQDGPRMDAAARAVPIALFYRSRRVAASMAEAQTLVTHTSSHDVEAARLYVIALYETLRGLSPRRLAGVLADEAGDPVLRELMARLEDLAGEPLGRAARLLAPVPGGDPHPFAAALYAYMESPGNPLEAARTAAAVAPGSADAAAAMAAALAAAHGGLEAVDPGLLGRLEAGSWALEAGRRLYQAARSRHGESPAS
ncbi:hypothetical protein CF15_07670 [Pyrodictium occultum]|uniref:ADP-ribosylglycohydrolase n=1 Tax=Pyrodictium occultum TaxID=2309 RepID=A0A0V8RX46_PYROC|nr:ADP-ribosylglycohydrolase family protein [Pyrodictium occultum]KSW12584.1 hypothetical protein CF15_07670 [Pyrodictium occultum]